MIPHFHRTASQWQTKLEIEYWNKILFQCTGNHFNIWWCAPSFSEFDITFGQWIPGVRACWISRTVLMLQMLFLIAFFTTYHIFSIGIKIWVLLLPEKKSLNVIPLLPVLIDLWLWIRHCNLESTTVLGQNIWYYQAIGLHPVPWCI